MTEFYFGEPPWLYADIENATKRPVPVGATCVYCPELIAEGDHGGWVNYTDASGYSSLSAYHHECHIVTAFGSAEHVLPILTGEGDHVCDPPGKCQEGKTRRELGREIIAEIAVYNDSHMAE
jgi:hypothetical protein